MSGRRSFNGIFAAENWMTDSDVARILKGGIQFFENVGHRGWPTKRIFAFLIG